MYWVSRGAKGWLGGASGMIFGAKNVPFKFKIIRRSCKKVRTESIKGCHGMPRGVKC